MNTNEYKFQSLLTMDEFPNYPSNDLVTKNRAYFTINDIDMTELLNKGISRNITAYSCPPTLDDNAFLVTVDLNKIDMFTYIPNNPVPGVICSYDIDFISPQAILFIDFVFVLNKDKKLRISLGEMEWYLDHHTLENGDKGLIKFLRSLKKEEDNFIYIDFYELLDILVLYNMINRKICDSFI